ncbi:MAG: calcium/sodium antiporter [Bacteroidales bacterium]|nr:calcium/sodium antiporter [Bacteroidales bacterium]
MTVPILLIIAALILVAGGAHFLVEGSSRIASKFGISDMVIGMTIVAIGTSMPELVTSLLGALKGSAGIAVGNVVGSNICNILLIVGLSALIYPLSVSKENINRDMQFVLLSTIVLLVIAFDSQIDSLTIDDNMASNFISRSDGIILILFFIIFMFYSVISAKRKEGNENRANTESSEEPKKNVNIPLALLMVAGGLGALIWGGQLLVDNAIIVAKHYGVSDVVIGSTIVAIGTSLPELAASVVAAIRKKVGMALGNIVGSNIFNVFLILGGSAVITPLQLESINHIHFVFLLLATLLLLLAARTSMKIRRIEGFLLLAFYALYITVNLSVK